MPEQILTQMRKRCEKAIEVFRSEIASIRTGRATPALVEDIMVECYEDKMPIRSVAAISTPEPRLIVVQPWDQSIIEAVEKAIRKSDLGFSPVTEGSIIRIPIPPLTEERRKEFVKQLRLKMEEFRVQIRNFRKEAMNSIRRFKEDKEISEDEERRYKKRIQEIHDEFMEKIEELGKKKEEELRCF